MKKNPLVITVLTLLCVMLHVQPVMSHESWTATWASAQEFTADHDMPQTSLTDCAIRQVVHVSIGGSTMRLHLSNVFSREAVVIKSVYVADALEGSAIDGKRAKYLTFAGRRTVTIQPGEAVCSDAVDYPLQPLQRLAITVSYGQMPKNATVHRGARTTSYIMKGESKPKKPFVTTEETERWFSIAAIDVATDGAAMPCVAVLGNSITDGRGTTTNAQNRWTDIFAEALQGRVAVLNLGIGGNCVISGGISQPAMQRFDRDILAQSGLSAVVIFEGINDIGNSSQSEETVRQLIAAYQELIGKCRRQGLKVFGATITPLGDSDYRSFFHEAARQTVNQWIRTCGLYDAVIDFDQLVRDPAQPDKIPAKWLFDPLHPNADCYRVMGLHAAEVLRPLLEAR